MALLLLLLWGWQVGWQGQHDQEVPGPCAVGQVCEEWVGHRELLHQAMQRKQRWWLASAHAVQEVGYCDTVRQQGQRSAILFQANL
jgi:hypothetical protein